MFEDEENRDLMQRVLLIWSLSHSEVLNYIVLLYFGLSILNFSLKMVVLFINSMVVLFITDIVSTGNERIVGCVTLCLK